MGETATQDGVLHTRPYQRYTHMSLCVCLQSHQQRSEQWWLFKYLCEMEKNLKCSDTSIPWNNLQGATAPSSKLCLLLTEIGTICIDS